MNNDNIRKAIELEVCFVKKWGEKIRCFDRKMGYGEFVDLTPEEYEKYQKIAHISKSEQLQRLETI